MKWDRKPVRFVDEDRKAKALERKADSLLHEAERHRRVTKKRRPATPNRAAKVHGTYKPHAAATEVPEFNAYRSIGSVLQRDGLWSAIGENGIVLGTFRTRAEAWQVADKCGLEKIEL